MEEDDPWLLKGIASLKKALFELRLWELVAEFSKSIFGGKKYFDPFRAITFYLRGFRFMAQINGSMTFTQIHKTTDMQKKFCNNYREFSIHFAVHRYVKF